MSASPLTRSLERLTENRLASSLVSLVTLLAGIATVSLPLLLLSGVFAYGWPFLHIYFNRVNATATNAPAAPKKLATLRTGTAAAH